MADDLVARLWEAGVDGAHTGTVAGRLVLNVMAAVSQWEKAAIGERAREALGQKRAAGQRVGTIPFGYQLAADGSSLQPNTAEQRVSVILASLREAGYTLHAISDELNRQGFRTRRRTAWQVRRVHHLLAG